MAALRDPDRGCPWDREQSFETIAPYTVEEAYEVADAIARRDLASLPDELGDLLFQVVTRRYEKRSLVLTTNLPFSAWPTIFPNAGSAIALIDRLVHHAEIITVEGDSYRRRVAEAKRKTPRPPAAGPNSRAS